MTRETRGAGSQSSMIGRHTCPELMNLYLQGRFAFDKLGKFYSFEQINEAVSDSGNGTTVKPILRIGG